MLVGTLPDLTSSLRASPSVEAHALTLDALAGKCVDRLRRRGTSGGDHDEFAFDAAGDLDEFCALVESGAIDAHVDLGSGTDHSEEPCRPRGQATRRGLGVLVIDRSDNLLSGRGEPHAVHDRAAEAGEQCCRVGRVDRVVIARDLGERGHVARGDDGRLTTATTRGVLGVGRNRATGAGRIDEFALAGASTNCEAFHQCCDSGSVEAFTEHCSDFDGHLDDATEIGVEHLAGLCLDDQDRRVGRQCADQVDAVVEVDQVEHALDDVDARARTSGTENREDGRPAGSDEHVGHCATADGQRLGQARSGDSCVIGYEIGNPREVDSCRTVLDLWKILSCSNSEKCRHGLLRIVGGDDGCAAVDRGRRDGESDAHLFAGR